MPWVEAGPTVPDPRAIFGASLRLWLRADVGVTVTGSGVSLWADQSGNGNNAVQAVDANRPPLDTVGGRPAVATDAVRYLTIPDNASLRMVAGQAFGVYVVLRSADSNTVRGAIGKFASAAAGYEWALNCNDSTAAECSFYTQTTGLGLKESPVAMDASCAADIALGGQLTTGATLRTGLNGGWSAPVALGSPIQIGAAQVSLGRIAFDANGLVASLREIIIWRMATDLTAAQDRAALKWFRSRWDIP
jgi:hypothetical protein